MSKLAMGLSIVVAIAVFSTMGVTAKDRKTTIHIERNYDTTGAIKAECITTVATDPIPSVKGDKIMWQVEQGNGQNHDDDCPSVDFTKVVLQFSDNVMGSAAMKKLTSNGGGVIQGAVSKDSSEAPKGKHKYQILYKGLTAGPDPEIDVDCPNCRPKTESASKE
jgi:hypothetical protein